MKTTDLLYQNQKVLNALQEMLLTSKKHVEFLAANAPEIRTSLESIAESLQNQAYDFIAAEKLVGRFKTFCECYPTNLYIGLTGADIMKDK